MALYAPNYIISKEKWIGKPTLSRRWAANGNEGKIEASARQEQGNKMWDMTPKEMCTYKNAALLFECAASAESFGQSAIFQKKRRQIICRHSRQFERKKNSILLLRKSRWLMTKIYVRDSEDLRETCSLRSTWCVRVLFKVPCCSERSTKGPALTFTDR